MKGAKFVIITAGGLNGRRLAHLFSYNNIPYDLLTISFPLPKRKNGYSFNHSKKYIRGILANIDFLRKLKMRHLTAYPKKEQFVGRQNGKRMLNALQQIKPDYIFMMGGGILKDHIISTARKGVLNAHPAILPFIRGVDAIKHSILKDVPIGVTGHFIDKGIDTGAIIERYWLPVEKGDSFQDIQLKADRLSVAVMAKFALSILKGLDLNTSSQQKKFPLCRKLSTSDTEQVIEKLNNNWYNTHQSRINTIEGLLSGKDLLEDYKPWWPVSEQF